MFELLERIPAEFWGVVIGSFFSLAGVALTNRANAKRLRLQFDHDRVLRVKERELALRKEVYLAAVEALSAGLLAVAKCSDLNVAEASVTEKYQEKAPAVARIHVIGTEETAKQANAITAELNSAFLKLFAKRIPLNVKKMEIGILDAQIARSHKEGERFIEMMKQFNLEGSTDQRRWNAIEGNFKYEQDRVGQLSQQRNVLTAQLTVGQLELAEEAFAEVRRLNLIIPRLLFAVRRELELPINEDSYTQIVHETMKKVEADVSTFLSQAKSLGTAKPSMPPQGPQS